MTIPDLPCPWGIDYDDVAAWCPGAPLVDGTEGGPAPGTITQATADAAILAATAAVWQSTGRKYGLCTTTARPCSHRGRCGGLCGAWCCSTTYYDRLDLDPRGRAPVVSVDTVIVAGSELAAGTDYTLVDSRWLLRLPAGTRWPTRSDIAGDPPDVELAWTHGVAPTTDLALNAVVPLACELAKKAAGQECSIPDRVVSVSREGASFVMTDITALVQEGLVGPPGVIAAIRRDHPLGPAVGSPGVFDPAAYSGFATLGE